MKTDHYKLMKDKKETWIGWRKKDDTSPKFQFSRICIFRPLQHVQATDTVRDMQKGKYLQIEIVDLLCSYPFLLYSSFPLMFVFVQFLFIPNITVSLIHQFQIISILECNAIVTNFTYILSLSILAHNSSKAMMMMMMMMTSMSWVTCQWQMSWDPAVATEETKMLFTSKPSKKGFSEILVHYLEKSAKKTREVEQKVNALLYSCNLKHYLILTCILHYKMQTCIFVFQIQ